MTIKVIPTILFCFVSLSFLGQNANDIHKSDSCFIKVPDSLSVNAEDKRWQISCDCAISDFQITVYDRWGEKKYESDVLDNSRIIPWEYWTLKTATYLWKIEYRAEYKGGIIKKKQSGRVICY